MTTNGERAQLARAAIDAYQVHHQGGQDLEDTVTDLVADVLHYAREQKLKPSRVADRALGIWRAEERDPSGDETNVQPTSNIKALYYGLAFAGAVSVLLLMADEIGEPLTTLIH